MSFIVGAIFGGLTVVVLGIVVIYRELYRWWSGT